MSKFEVDAQTIPENPLIQWPHLFLVSDNPGHKLSKLQPPFFFYGKPGYGGDVVEENRY